MPVKIRTFDNEDQVALAIATLGVSFAQVLCAEDSALHRRLNEAATRNCALLDSHGEHLAADLLATFVRALNDPELFPEAAESAPPQRAGRADSRTG